MKPWHKVMLAGAIVVIDTLVFYIPLTSILADYVIVARPAWFLRLVAKIYKIPDRAKTDEEA